MPHLPSQWISFNGNVKLRVSLVWLVLKPLFKHSFLGDKEKRREGMHVLSQHGELTHPWFMLLGLFLFLPVTRLRPWTQLGSQFLHCARHSFAHELGCGLGSHIALPLPSGLLSQIQLPGLLLIPGILITTHALFCIKSLEYSPNGKTDKNPRILQKLEWWLANMIHWRHRDLSNSIHTQQDLAVKILAITSRSATNQIPDTLSKQTATSKGHNLKPVVARYRHYQALPQQDRSLNLLYYTPKYGLHPTSLIMMGSIRTRNTINTIKTYNGVLNFTGHRFTEGVCSPWIPGWLSQDSVRSAVRFRKMQLRASILSVRDTADVQLPR